MLLDVINRQPALVVKGPSVQHAADQCAFRAHELHISPGPNMKASICILLAALTHSFCVCVCVCLCVFGCLGRAPLTEELEIKPPFEKLLISQHHLLDWFGIVKSKSFTMDFASERPVPSRRDQSS